MNKVTSYVVGAIAVIALIIAIAVPKATGPVGKTGLQGPRGEQGPAGRDGVTTVVTKTIPAETPKFGAFPGADFISPMSLNNMKTIGDRANFRAATTTPCSFLVTATSSLSFFSLNVASSSAQAATYAIGTSTSPNATTSVIATFTPLAAGAQGSQVWYNTTSGTNQIGNITPGTFLNMSVAGVTGGSPGGACQFEAKIF